jgi:hypothetical protein
MDGIRPRALGGAGRDDQLDQPAEYGRAGVHRETFFAGEIACRFANVFGSDDYVEVVLALETRLAGYELNPAQYAHGGINASDELHDRRRYRAVVASS